MYYYSNKLYLANDLHFLSVSSQVLPVVAQELPSTPHGCMEGSCYPATGNLLIGRAINLTATSTCGLDRPEQYCIVSHLQDLNKCFKCDSQEPYDAYHHKKNHRVENVIYQRDSRGELTWWQSVNGEENVSIRLNLEAEFHFTHLIMKFKTFRPAAMIIERSSDFGRTWRPYRYFAYNCTKTFPRVPAHSLRFTDEVICEERYSDIEPSTEGEVIYKVLDPAIHVKDPYSLDIQGILAWWVSVKLRYELVVRGSCFCYGHASECAPVPGVTTRDSSMIHGHCVCKHNTVGLNCERCRDFYHNAPWRPAETDNAHTCRECNCNGHSNQCHFDMAVYLATGNVSGGVCDDCLHNTMGRNCETCKHFYYQDPTRDIRDPAACIPCDCDPVGSVEGGVCDSHTDLDLGMIGGQCRCKQNIRGQRCDYCKEGHYGLSLDNPLGCQPCNCDPRGITMLGAPCDQISGDCSCKRYVTGRYCNQCLPEYWGLSNDLAGCRPCDCDFGGATSIRCRMDNGQCECRPHLIGRQCSEVQPAFFCASLDNNKHEAEEALGHSSDDPRQPGQMVTWTGPGFARVKDGAGLKFTISNVPYAMEYDIMIRYEPEVCGLKHLRDCFETWYVDMPRPFCFEPNNQYVVSIRFQRHAVSHRHLTAFTLIDSLVLIPRYEELPGFQGDDSPDERRRQEMELYMCLDSFMTVPMPALAELCTTLICSISAIMYNGALGESHSDGFELFVSAACQCDPQGSLSCDPVTGQCPCQHGATGRQCSECQPGQWGFPNCRQCQCNGHAEICDPETGACYECRDYTAGQLCERCVNGFYGNPILGSGEHCRPCPCPGHPDSGHSNGASCHADYASNQILCQCGEGYAGPRCDRCAPGYYGDPEQPGRTCRPCQCNGNIDPQDPESCDPRTGQCLKCLYNTDGHLCSECKSGYYGNALAQDCRRCTCVTAGTLEDYCTDGVCHCDKQTGQCPCKPNIIGHNCDQCSPNHWNFGSDCGCEPCECSQPNALSTHCNMFSGQCHCQPGFGGRQCNECEAFHWGDPRVQCEECNCHPLGSDMAQCDRVTGACVCKEEASGRHCDECAHGFTGNFPKCIPCHPCFQLWDDAICQIGRDLTHIKDVIAMILEKGEVPGLSDGRIRELEKKLAQVQDLIRDGDRERTYNLISQANDDLRAEIALTDGRLMGVSRELNVTADLDNALKRNLTALEKELKDLNNTLHRLHIELDNYLTAGFAGKYYQSSLNSEKRCNASVYGPQSPVEQSEDTRNRTEALLKERKDLFLRTVAANNKSLKPLTLSVCGGHGNASANSSCPNSPCGGAGCRDSDGALKCGGKGCKGTVGASVTLVQCVHMLVKEPESFLLTSQLRDIATLTQTVKNQAKDTLDKAQSKKELFENSNNILKDFIEKIKDFLNEEGADPESIEKVAQQVLAISLPVNRTVIVNVVEQIKANIANLTNVEGVFNHTSEQLAEVRDLLKRAQDANDNINKTKEALETSQSAIKIAEKEMTTALENLKNAQNITTMNRYKELIEKVDSVGGTGEGDINQRAIEMKKEAEELLKKATVGMETLRSMCSSALIIY
uniref:Laminin subunit beta-1-like n=1 Tax=Sinocyclocheilus anshuiensis TaxID=1608454 RepID=A0A671QX29_9TELE